MAGYVILTRVFSAAVIVGALEALGPHGVIVTADGGVVAD
jgi:hypothetical protein